MVAGVWTLTLFILAVSGRHVTAELFSASATVDSLVETERTVNDLIEAYIAKERDRLSNLERIVRKDLTSASEPKRNSSRDESHGIANPIQAFLLISKLSVEWRDTENLLRSTATEEFMHNLTVVKQRLSGKFPDEQDFKGVVDAVLRLQDVYQLSAHEMASGHIANAPAAKEMNAYHCYWIGMIAFHKKDYYHSLMWAQEALDRLATEQSPSIDKADILEVLAYSQYYQGNVQHALRTALALREFEPESQELADDIEHLEEQLKKATSAGKASLDSDDDVHNNGSRLPPLQNPRPEQTAEQAKTDFLCRTDDLTAPPSVAKELYCYLKRDRPYLKLAPIKVEIMHWKPKIIFFRQVISDKEIQTLQELALPMLKRALIRNSRTKVLETADYRTSQSAWLADDIPLVKRISRRADDMTELVMQTADLLQMGNYGIGGHYAAHYDMATRLSQPEDHEFGSRIATVLFYLSTPIGGRTVFPRLDAGVAPSKNDAVFWHNLMRSGEADELTYHAACPVLAGSKWVANIWVRERAQEFRRPCALTSEEYE